MVSPEFLVDALAASAEGPPGWFEIYVDEGTKTLRMVRHELDELFGCQATATCDAVGVVAGGRAHAMEGRGEIGEVPPGRVRVILALDRHGATASLATTEDGDELDGPCTGGRMVDALHRTLGLETPPPPVTPAALIAELWLAAVVSEIEDSGQALRWDDVAELHPAVCSVRSMHEDLGPAEVEAIISLAPRVWTWDLLREQTAAGGGVADLVPSELAEWMDDGMFARWALEAGPDQSSLWGLVAAGIDEDAAIRLARALDHGERCEPIQTRP